MKLKICDKRSNKNWNYSGSQSSRSPRDYEDQLKTPAFDHHHWHLTSASSYDWGQQFSMGHGTLSQNHGTFPFPCNFYGPVEFCRIRYYWPVITFIFQYKTNFAKLSDKTASLLKMPLQHKKIFHQWSIVDDCTQSDGRCHLLIIPKVLNLLNK